MYSKTTKVIIAGVLAVSVVGFFIWYIWEQVYHKPLYTIGMVYVPSRAFHEQINGALLAAIRADKRFAIKEFTAASAADLILVNTTCNAAVESPCDIIVCTGISCAQGTVQVAARRGSKKPIVFMGVSGPVELGLVESIEIPGGSTTGVVSSNFNGKIDLAQLLLTIKPSMKALLLPYAVIADGNEIQAQAIKKWLEKHNVKTTLLPIDNVTDTLVRVTPLASEHDTLMYLEADALANYGAGLGKLASQHTITMFAGSIDGVKDAALSYVPDTACLAHAVFDIVKEILIEKKDAGAIPVRETLNNMKLIINTKLCAEQGLADIDIPKIIKTIHADERLAAVHGNIVIQ